MRVIFEGGPLDGQMHELPVGVTSWKVPVMDPAIEELLVKESNLKPDEVVGFTTVEYRYSHMVFKIRSGPSL